MDLLISGIPVVERQWIEPYSYWAYWDSYSGTGTLTTVRGHYGDVVVGPLSIIEDTHPGLSAFYDSQDCPTCGQTLRRAAGVMNDWRTYAGWYGASAALGTMGWVVYDYSLGPSASQLFGKDLFCYAASNGPGLLNNSANSFLRIGFGWQGPEVGGNMVFRVAGDAIETLTGEPHINLWNVEWP